ncbi:thiosulfate oxidation carrier protein SoxY [Bradyrhizobium sp.]|uniref:thiosulfate oxidation carrier protein SoxY n=1 Tax=Bradyrhizobium sp. TaxID=376 RepID=UPI002614F978|nr:thiosulfate oxidation carrier protein SoxY [Bradyrhizobium sp.]
MTTSIGRFPVTRRLVLRGAGFVTLAGFGITSFAPAALAAANDKYPEDAFRQKDGKEAIRLLYGRTAEPSDQIKLDAPEIAENGAVVPISVSTSLPNVTSVAFVVPANPNVLAAYYKIPEGTMPDIANRLKMAKTSSVIALVESGGKLFSAAKEVKVTIGGCGG